MQTHGQRGNEYALSQALVQAEQAQRCGDVCGQRRKSAVHAGAAHDWRAWRGRIGDVWMRRLIRLRQVHYAAVGRARGRYCGSVMLGQASEVREGLHLCARTSPSRLRAR